jgi:hypothetical protein
MKNLRIIGLIVAISLGANMMAELPGNNVAQKYTKRAIRTGLQTSQQGSKKLWSFIKNHPKTIISLGVVSAMAISVVFMVACVVKSFGNHKSEHNADC